MLVLVCRDCLSSTLGATQACREWRGPPCWVRCHSRVWGRRAMQPEVAPSRTCRHEALKLLSSLIIAPQKWCLGIDYFHKFSLWFPRWEKRLD